ncbi:MAG: flagellar basal-body rod protein FlgF [Alphaproteobacteria bacterium]
MENTTLVALSQQMVLRRQMDVIANNIANADTGGYKSERMLFATYLQDIGRREKAAFVQDIAVTRDPRDGEMVVTGNPFDMAIQGEGYFQVETPDGVRYTRGGHFRLDDQGVLVTSDGHALLGDDGFPVITSPDDNDLVVTPDGTVSAGGFEIARLQVVTFERPNALRETYGGLYQTDLTPLPSEDARIVQGSIESSNVEPIVEMTRMIALLRGYQSVQRLVQEQDQLRRRAISALSGTNRTA